MNQILDCLFYNKARERFRSWASNNIDLSVLISFTCRYSDPYVSKAALQRIIRVWCHDMGYTAAFHTSILDFKEKEYDNNTIHVVFIPADGWKYIKSVYYFAIETLKPCKIIFIPYIRSIPDRIAIRFIKSCMIHQSPSVDDIKMELDKKSCEYKIQTIFHHIEKIFSSDFYRVVLLEVEPDEYEQFVSASYIFSIQYRTIKHLTEIIKIRDLNKNDLTDSMINNMKMLTGDYYKGKFILLIPYSGDNEDISRMNHICSVLYMHGFSVYARNVNVLFRNLLV